MGYVTDFTVNANFSKIEEEKKELVELKVERTLRNHGYSITLGYTFSGKWYDWRNDMIAISKEHPDVLFTVEGKGEESEDIWEAEFINGQHRTRTVKFVFPDWGEFE